MKTRFFCDHCGREVAAESVRCPGCGKFFSAVKCPRCAFQGEAKLFRSGCPVCGYLFREGAGPAAKRPAPPFISRQTFRLLTALLLLLALVFIVLLVISPFNR
jgi:hypothetical protein